MRRAWDARAVVPYFQPIIAVERMQVVGYEVLGRLKTPHGVVSLGPFFQDVRVAVDEKIRMDRWIVHQAFKACGGLPAPPLLFLNVNPAWGEAALDAYRHDLLADASRFGIPPEKLVFEVTESPSAGSDQVLRDIVERFRASGCRVGLDDVGSGFSQLDRVALVRPDFLKVDMRIVQQSTHAASYYHLLEGLAVIAQKLGSLLLVEGIETEAELAVALSVGSQYLQGYLFSPPNADRVEPHQFAAVVRGALDALRRRQQDRLRARTLIRRQLATRLRQEVGDLTAADFAHPRTRDHRLGHVLTALPACCWRLYLCDAQGNQLSANVERGPQGVTSDAAFVGSNWTVRPYFLRNVAEAARTPEGALSEPYRDHQTRQPTVTYTYALADDLFLFVDCRLEDLDRSWDSAIKTPCRCEGTSPAPAMPGHGRATADMETVEGG